MISGLNHITIAVADLTRSVDFYTRILGFKGHVVWDGGAYLSGPGIWLCLSLDVPSPAGDYSHLAFSVGRENYPLLSQKIIDYGVKQWKLNKSEGDSLYFLDPDGYKLEIHVGNLQDRLRSLETAPYKGLKWL